MIKLCNRSSIMNSKKLLRMATAAKFSISNLSQLSGAAGGGTFHTEWQSEYP
jgi:hypothetical protein